MKIEECVKGLKYLGLAYSKEFDEEECKVYYDFLKKYEYESFKMAVKSIIKNSKFLPKISELVEECEKYKQYYTFKILEFMKSLNYFKSVNESDKATKYLETGVIPSWFKEDMNKYYKMMKQEIISQDEKIMIGTLKNEHI